MAADVDETIASLSQPGFFTPRRAPRDVVSEVGSAAFSSPLREPPVRRQRLNEEGESAPGTQHAALASQTERSLHIDAPQQASSLQSANGKWNCTFCQATVASRSYLVTHTRRDHEGDPSCLGPGMVAFLVGMSRWLCPLCYRSNRRCTALCDHRGSSRDDEIDGSSPEVPAVARLQYDLQDPDVAEVPLEPVADAVIQPVLPTLEEVFCRRVSLAKRVPLRSRPAWAEVLAEELARSVALNTVESWTRLLMLPKTILWLPKHKRGGRAAAQADFGQCNQ